MSEFTNINACRDVSVGFDSRSDGVADCQRNCKVVVYFTSYVSIGNFDRNTKPRAIACFLTKFDTVDLKLSVDDVALYQVRRSGDAVVLVGGRVECDFLDDGRCSHTGNTQVSNRCLLEECFYSVVASKSSAASCWQCADKILVLIKRLNRNRTIVGECEEG